MQTLATLKLISSKQNRITNPIMSRRNKLAAKIAEQIAVVTAQQDGRVYTAKRTKSVTNRDTGVTHTLETNVRVKEWFWTADNGKINLCVRYGSKVLSLAKDKNAIEVDNKDELLNALNLIKNAVVMGELDAAILAVTRPLKNGAVK